MSNIDTLLDFDTPAENGSNQKTGNHTNTHSLDDFEFDPFGPSPTMETKGGGGSNDLMLNYEVTVQNGTDAENGSDNVNLLYEMDKGRGGNLLQYEEDDNESDHDRDHFASLIKEQTANGEDSEISVTETVNTGEDGSVTVVTTRRSQSYDSDHGDDESTRNTQVVEEVMSRSDDGMTVTKVITTTTTESSYYDDDSDGGEQPSHEEQPSHDEQSYEQSSLEHHEDVSFEQPEEVSFEQSEQESYEHSEQASLEQSSFEQPSREDDKRAQRSRSPSISPDHTRSGSVSSSEGEHEQEQIQLDDSSNQEEEIIKNGATFYRTKDETHTSEVRKSDDHGSEQQETQRMVKEEVAPGQLRSPFFGDTPMPQNGVENQPERDPNIARETRDRDEIRFGELSNFKNKFEVGVTSEKTATVSPNELDQVRQSSGAGNLRNKFETVARGGDSMSQVPKPVRQITPPLETSKVVYESEAVRDPNVVRAEDVVDEGAYLPKPGASKQIWEKFQSGRIQDSAPRQRTSVIDEIQAVEGGVFENEPQINPDVVRSGEGDMGADLPTSGSTRNVLSKFKQMESSAGYVPAPRGVREITPPSGGKVEYVSEPSRRLDKYVGKAESGIFESQPEYRTDVVRSGEIEEEQDLPKQGFTRGAAALFRQKQAEASRVKVSTSGRAKEITPPRDAAVVYESQPQRIPDVIRSEDKIEEDDLPHQGAARNMLARFREMESGHQSSQAPRQMKAFTPPRDGGVYENEPDKFIPNYNAKAEGGVFENQPQHRGDVVRAEDKYEEELPERGMARNLVARFRQLSDSTKSQSPLSPKSPLDRSFKEFTPPREEPRTPISMSGVQPSDMPEQYQQSSGGISENAPQFRADVLRESDTDYYAGMPQASTTKNLLARFKTIQQDAKVNEQAKAPVRKPRNILR